MSANLFGTCVTKSEFIYAWGNEALKHYPTEKVLPSLPICQAILESGWGTSGISITLNNYHGMNYYNDSVTSGYEFEERTTYQERNGVLVPSKEYFCKFGTMEEEMECYYKWLNRNKDAYRAIHGNTDALENFVLIKQAGYATSSRYTQSLTRIYNQYPEIQAFDDEVLTPRPTATHFYIVQTGAFKVYDNAVAQTKELAEANLPSYINKIDGYYKVQVGAFTVYENAVKCAKDVAEKCFKSIIVERDVEN